MKSAQGGDIQALFSSMDALPLGSERGGQEKPDRVDSGVGAELLDQGETEL